MQKSAYSVPGVRLQRTFVVYLKSSSESLTKGHVEVQYQNTNLFPHMYSWGQISIFWL